MWYDDFTLKVFLTLIESCCVDDIPAEEANIGQEGEIIGVIDVLLCGLNFIIPLMTENLLKVWLIKCWRYKSYNSFTDRRYEVNFVYKY